MLALSFRYFLADNSIKILHGLWPIDETIIELIRILRGLTPDCAGFDLLGHKANMMN